jgi:hypothetical protein
MVPLYNVKCKPVRLSTERSGVEEESKMKALAGAVLAGAAVYVALLAATGRPLPFGLSGNAAVWTVAALGMSACGVAGIGDVVARAGGNWASPWVLAGIVLGTIGLVAIACAVSGFSLGPIAGRSAWLLVFATVVGVKVVVATAQVASSAAVVALTRG